MEDKIMTATAARTQAKELIELVPDDKIYFIINYIQSFISKKNKSSSINIKKKMAYDSLIADAVNMSGQKISLNGEDEVADIILKKYESLN